MGYESRIYIVWKSDVGTAFVNKKYGQIIARFDLGKVGGVPCCRKESDYYIYEGNKAVTEDLYGDSLKQCSIGEFVNWINSLGREDKKYFMPIKSYIAALLKYYTSDDMAVIHYGY